MLDNDCFTANQPLFYTDDRSLTAFQMESEVIGAHTATLHLTVSVPGSYTMSNNQALATTTNLVACQATILSLAIDACASSQPFVITR